MLLRILKKLFLLRQLLTNICIGTIVLLYGSILLVPLASRAEKSFVQNQVTQDITQELKDALILTNHLPVKGETPFQTLENKVKSLGYTLDSFMPESVASTSQSGDSILDEVIAENVQKLVISYAAIEGIKKSTTLSDSEKKEQLQHKIEMNKTLNKGLNELKSRYSNKFNTSLEDKVSFIKELDCTPHSGGALSCGMSEFTTMNKLKETGLKKNTALGKAFSEGALTGLLDPKLILSEEEYNQRNNIEKELAADEEIKPAVTEAEPPKNQKDCASKSLNIYRKKIESISTSDYVSFVTEGQASPCRLLRLAYSIQQKPFKRILKEGTIFDWNGKTMTLDQKSFDDILKSWGVLNGAKSAKPSKVQSNSTKSQGRSSKRSTGKR